MNQPSLLELVVPVLPATGRPIGGGAAGSCHHRRLEEVRHLRGYPGSDEDPRFVDLMLVEKLAIGGGDAADAERDDRDTLLRDGKIGRASCRERVCQYV